MDDSRLYINVDAEESVLGMAVMYPDECLRKVCEIPQDAMYYDQDKVLLDCLKSMEREKVTVDMISVADWLVKHQKTEQVKVADIARMCTNVIGPSFLPSHMKILMDCYTRRRQRMIAREYGQKLDAGEDPDECREWMLRSLTEVKQQTETGLISMMDAVIRTYDQLSEDQVKEGEPTKRILSGISTMDNKLGGLRGSEYVAIGARPSVGKSIFALTYCLNAAKQGKRVLLVSLEMNEVQITERIFASQTDVTLNEMESGQITEQGWEKMAQGLGKIGNLPLWIHLEADTVPKVRRAAYQLYEDGGIDMIAIDYIQLMDASNNKRQNRQEEIAEISRGLRKLAAELKIPILVLTQLNRNSAKGQMIKGQKVRQEPTMSEARESGAIEQDANLFLLLHDPEESEMRNEEEKDTYRNLKQQGYQMMRIIIDKNRQGKRGRVTLAFDGDHMRFLPIVRNTDTPY